MTTLEQTSAPQSTLGLSRAQLTPWAPWLGIVIGTALASLIVLLGSWSWYAVFPHARSGMIAGMMLGLGRALGETMAVTMVLSAGGPLMTWQIITSNNPATIASNIAARFNGEDVGIQSVLLATGLILFVFTFAVNFLARWAIARGERKFA